MSIGEVLKKVADHLGVSESKPSKNDPAKDLKFQDWSSELVKHFTSKKAGITEESLLAAGARFAKYKRSLTVIAIPIIGESLNTESRSKEGDRGHSSQRLVRDGFDPTERAEVSAHVKRPIGPTKRLTNATTKPMRRKLRDTSHRPHKIIRDDPVRMTVGSQVADPRLREWRRPFELCFMTGPSFHCEIAAAPRIDA